MLDSTLHIGYAGSLKGHVPGSEHQPWWRPIADWVWTFRNRNLKHHTRSGYYLLQGMAHLRDTSEHPPKIHLHLWGLIDPIHQTQVDAMGLSDLVTIEGYFSKPESAAKLAACDVLFLPLETSDDPLFIPGKVFDYMRLGKPVLALGPASDCTRILERAGLGIHVAPEPAEEVAATLAQLVGQKHQLPELYQADQAYIEETFHFSHLAERMDAVFQQVLSS